MREQLAGDRAGGDARRRLARAGALEDVAHVARGRTSRRRRDPHGRAAAGSPARAARRRHRAAAPSVTRIVYCQFGQSRFSIIIAIGLPIVSPGANAGEDLRGIRLDRHAPAAPVAALAAAQVARDRVEVDGKPGGNAFENDDERAAVRLAGGQKSHHSREIVYEVSALPGRSARASRQRNRPDSTRRRRLALGRRRHARADRRSFRRADGRGTSISRRARRVSSPPVARHGNAQQSVWADTLRDALRGSAIRCSTHSLDYGDGGTPCTCSRPMTSAPPARAPPAPPARGSIASRRPFPRDARGAADGRERAAMRRPPVVQGRRRRGRPVGIVVQPRRALDAICRRAARRRARRRRVASTSAARMAAACARCGGWSARAARLAGYVPVLRRACSMRGRGSPRRWPRDMSRCSSKRATQRPPTVRVGTALRLGAASARRHVLIDFWRGARAAASRAVRTRPAWECTAMQAMIYERSRTRDRRGGGRSGTASRRTAIRECCVEQLHGLALGGRAARSRCVPRVARRLRSGAGTPRRCRRRRAKVAPGSVLQRAPARAQRLARTGVMRRQRRLARARTARRSRHAATRERAAQCALALGWTAPRSRASRRGPANVRAGAPLAGQHARRPAAVDRASASRLPTSDRLERGGGAAAFASGRRRHCCRHRRRSGRATLARARRHVCQGRADEARAACASRLATRTSTSLGLQSPGSRSRRRPRHRRPRVRRPRGRDRARASLRDAASSRRRGAAC